MKKKKQGQQFIKCRAKRDFWSPDNASLFHKGFEFDRLSGVLRDEWLRRGFIEIIGEEAAETKKQVTKPKDIPVEKEVLQPIVRTG